MHTAISALSAVAFLWIGGYGATCVAVRAAARWPDPQGEQIRGIFPPAAYSRLLLVWPLVYVRFMRAWWTTRPR